MKRYVSPAAFFKSLLAALLLMVLGSQVVLAAATTVNKDPGPLACTAGEPTEEGGGKTNCNCREKYEGYLLSVIVPCLREEVISVTKRVTNEFAPYLQTAIGAFLTLVVAIFGVQILMAEGDPKKEGFILLIKIAAVTGFMASYDELIIDPAFGIMNQGVEITTSMFNITAEYCEADFVNAYPNAEAPWIHYDCILGKLIGFGGTAIVGGAALGVASAALFSGQFGTIFFMGALLAIFFLLKLIIRGVYCYLIAVIALGLLVFISPLMIPLIWMPATQQYFDRWLGAVTAMIIIPAIVMAYLTLSFMILEKVVFDDEIGIATLLNQEEAEKLRGVERGPSRTSIGDTLVNDIDESQQASDVQYDVLIPVFSGSSDANLFTKFYTVDFRSDEAGTAGKLFFACVALLIISYILMALLEQIVAMAQMMVGGGFFMDSAVSDNDYEKALTSVQKTMQGSLKDSLSGASGVDGKAAAFTSGIVKGLASIPEALARVFSGKAT